VHGRESLGAVKLDDGIAHARSSQGFVECHCGRATP
jgi:hypothetical protein